MLDNLILLEFPTNNIDTFSLGEWRRNDNYQHCDYQ